MTRSTAFLRAAPLGACLIAATLAAPGALAQSLQLDLNNGRIGVAPERERYERGPVIIERERSGLSCGEGRRIVRENGFRDVRPVDCEGRTYTYSATRRGEPVEVRVSARDGRVVSVERF